MGVPESLPELLPEKQLVVGEKGLTRFPYEVSDVNQLEAVSLAGNRIQKLPKTFPALGTLILADNEIEGIPTKLMKRVATYPAPQVLDLSRHRITQIPAELEKAPQLKRLLLFRNKIKTFVLKRIELQHVDLGHNQLLTFPRCTDSIQTLSVDLNFIESSGTGYPNLVKMCVNRNLVKSIRPEVRFPVQVLLNISRNSLTAVPDLPEICAMLRHFNASWNSLAELPKFPTSIVEIFVHHNRITDVSPTFSGYANLIVADFSANQIEEVPHLTDLPSFQTFTLTGNRISQVGRIALPVLQRLVLDRNLLQTAPVIEGEVLRDYLLAFNRFTSVNWQEFSQTARKIDVSNNAIDVIPDDFFENLPQLEVFVACENRLARLPSTIVRSHLITLNIAANPIEELPERFPDSLEQLFCCGLPALPASLSANPELVTLVAPSNRLAELPALPHVEALNVSRNMLAAFPALSRRIRSLDLSCNAIAAVPDPFSYAMLVTVDLSHNQIGSWPARTSLPKVSSLKLAGNPLRAAVSVNALPNLRVLSVAETGVKLLGGPARLRVLSSRPAHIRAFGGRLIRPDRAVAAIAQLRGAREVAEDVAHVHAQGGLYTLFDAPTARQPVR
jgi:Leucine-rich repeat (LRR) protein